MSYCLLSTVATCDVKQDVKLCRKAKRKQTENTGVVYLVIQWVTWRTRFVTWPTILNMDNLTIWVNKRRIEFARLTSKLWKIKLSFLSLMGCKTRKRGRKILKVLYVELGTTVEKFFFSLSLFLQKITIVRVVQFWQQKVTSNSQTLVR